MPTGPIALQRLREKLRGCRSDFQHQDDGRAGTGRGAGVGGNYQTDSQSKGTVGDFSHIGHSSVDVWDTAQKEEQVCL